MPTASKGKFGWFFDWIALQTDKSVPVAACWLSKLRTGAILNPPTLRVARLTDFGAILYG